MRALAVVVLLRCVLAIDIQPSHPTCTPVHSETFIDGPRCLHCTCRDDVTVCRLTDERLCRRDDVTVIRMPRARRNVDILGITDIFARDRNKKNTNIQMSEPNPERSNQHELFIRNSNAKVFNTRKLNDAIKLSSTNEHLNPVEVSVFAKDNNNMKNNDIFSKIKLVKAKEIGKILQEHQTLALIRNSKSRVIKTGNTMSGNSKPRFARSHQKENAIKLNVKQKRTSYKKDLTKKFKKQNRYRNKREVEVFLVDVNNKELPLYTTVKAFETTPYTDVPITEEITTNLPENMITNEIDNTVEPVTPGHDVNSKIISVFGQTAEDSTDAIETETKHIFDIPDNTGNTGKVTKAVTASYPTEAGNIPEANDIKFQNWSQLDKVKNISKMFHWSKEGVSELNPAESILLHKFKRIFRKKSNVIRTKPFSINKTERVYVTDTPDLNTVVDKNFKLQFKTDVFQNITNLQHLLKEVLKRLKTVHTYDNQQVKNKDSVSVILNKFDGDIIWKLNAHEKKIKKQSNFLTGYKHIGICELNPRRQTIIESKVKQLHNITQIIFESIESLKNIEMNNITSEDHNKIIENTDQFVNTIGKFVFSLNEIINIATCHKNNKLQRILRHIGRRHTHNPIINEAMSKMKHLISKYSTVQNSFVSKMYEAVLNLNDYDTKLVKTQEKDYDSNKNTSKSTAEMDAITNKITKNLRKLMDLVQTMSKSGRAKRDTTGDDTMEMLLLIEYILKQKLAVRRPPVENGIDALIEAIRKAPDVRTVKNDILGLNTTSSNATTTTQPDYQEMEKDYNLVYERKLNNNHTHSKYLNRIARKKVRDNYEAISDVSSDAKSNPRLDDIGDIQVKRDKTDSFDKGIEDFDSGFQDDNNNKRIEVIINNLDESTQTDQVIKAHKKLAASTSISMETSENVDDATKEVFDIKVVKKQKMSKNKHRIPEVSKKEDINFKLADDDINDIYTIKTLDESRKKQTDQSNSLDYHYYHHTVLKD